MPPHSTSNEDFDDWEEVDAPFGLTPDSLAHLQLVFHDDSDLLSASVLLYQRFSHLSITGDQNDADTTEALQLVLSSLEQTTHNLSLTRADREDESAQIAENEELYVITLRERDEEIDSLNQALRFAARDLIARQRREVELNDQLGLYARDYDDLFTYQRDLIDQLTEAQIEVKMVRRDVQADCERRISAIGDKYEKWLKELHGENERLKELGGERDGEIERLGRECEELERLRSECAELRERADLLAEMGRMNGDVEGGRGTGKGEGKEQVDVGVQVDIDAKAETDTTVENREDKGKGPVSWSDAQSELERWLLNF